MKIDTSKVSKRVLKKAKKRNIRLGSYKRREITISEEVLSTYDELSFDEVEEIMKKYKDKHNARFELDYEEDVAYTPDGASTYETYFLTVCWNDLETDEEAAERVVKENPL